MTDQIADFVQRAKSFFRAQHRISGACCLETGERRMPIVDDMPLSRRQ